MMQAFTPNIELLEDFVKGKYTEGVANPLKDWEKSPGIQQYLKFLWKLHNNTRLTREELEILDSWMSNKRYGEHLNVLLKYCLQQIETESNQEKRKKLLEEFNSQFLHFSFNHERDARGGISSEQTIDVSKKDSQKEAPKGRQDGSKVPGTKAGLKIALTSEEQELMSTKTICKTIESDKSYYDWDLGSADQSFLKNLDFYNMESAHRIGVALGVLQDFAFCKDIYKVLKRYKKMMRKDNKYFTIPEQFFKKMTLQQLEDMDSDGDASESGTFQSLRYMARHHADLKIISDPYADLTDKRAALHNLYRITDKKGVKLVAIESLLINGYEQGIYDFDILIKFLDDPTQEISNFSERMCKRNYNNIWLGRQILIYKPSIVSSINIDQIIHLHVKEYVRDEKTMKNMMSYFNKSYLSGVLITNKALDGGNLNEFRDWFGATQTENFENMKVLEFNKQTKRVFKRNEPVQVFLNIKNIQVLKIKIFQLDTVHLYRSQKTTAYETLDLDGLIARDMMDFTFGYPKQQQFVHKVEFPEIQARDQCVFILEFLGGASNIRMVIRKGTLQILPTEHFQGINYHIVDEQKNICKGEGTGIFVDNRFYPTDVDGKVLFPFGKELTEGKQVVAMHKGFASQCRLSIPTETYSLKSAMIFHEEGLVCDQVNRLVFRNRIFLNNTPISLKKVSECSITVETNNFQSLKGFREFKGQVLSDEEDLVIELPTPKLLSHIEVVVHCKFRDLRGNEVHLQETHRVSVDRNHQADTFCTVHLKSSLIEKTNRKTYMLQVLGKNGEGIPDHRIRVQLIKIYGFYDFEHYLYTDKHGMAYLGDVDHVKYITAECPNGLFKQRLFTIPNEFEAMDIPSLIEMVVGDKLVLPSVNRKLSREVFEFFKVGKHPYHLENQMILSDCFDMLKSEGSSIATCSLLAGEYIFRYNLYPCRKIVIKVHEGVRWESNPFILEKNRSLTELRPESRYLSVLAFTKTDSHLSIALRTNSNTLTLRGHVLGYHFRPTLKERLTEQLLSISPQFSSRTTTIPRFECSQLEDRVLSDELAYVMERRHKPALVGNTLEKPSILLHREKVCETKDDEEVLNGGKDFSEDKFAKIQEAMHNREQVIIEKLDGESEDLYLKSGNRALCDARVNKRNGFFTRGGGGESIGFWKGLANSIFGGENQDFPGVDHSQRPRLEIRSARLPNEDVIMNNMDYCSNSGLVLANLKPDSAGSIHIPVDKLKGYGFYVLVICDLHSTLVLEYHEKTGQMVKKEMRPQQIMKPREILQVNYTVHMSDSSHKVEVRGVQGAQSTVLEDMECLRESLLCLAGSEVNKQELGEWAFITKWTNLSQQEKESKWDKYGGHELAVFSFLRDQKFFLEFIQPLLKSKVQQSIIDKLLSNFDPNLDTNLNWNDLASFDRIPNLSAVEILLILILSSKSSKDLRNNILIYVESIVNASHLENTQVKNVWESLLNRSTDAMNSMQDYNSELSGVHSKKEILPESSSKAPNKSGSIQLGGLLSSHALVVSRSKMSKESVEYGQLPEEKKDEMNKGQGFLAAGDSDPGFVKIEDIDKLLIIEEFKKAPLASEFRERQEHFIREYSQIPLNKQWLAIYQYITSQRSEGKSPAELLNPESWGFVSEELLFMKNSTAEIIAALTIAPLGMKKSRVVPIEVSSKAIKYQGSQPYFALIKSSRLDSGSESLELDIVVAQKFYDPNDKHVYDENDPKIFTIKEISEFLTAKIYESRVSVSNLSESSCNIELHTQVPEGALAVYDLEDFSTSTKSIDPMETKMFTFKFYFPAVGEYRVYPATITKNNRFINCARLGKDLDGTFKLKVVNDYRPDNKLLETLQDMISFGGAEDILKFMAEKNLFNSNLFDICKIRWVAKSSKQNFLRLVTLLRKNFMFDQATWAYSIYHCCHIEFIELMSVIASTFITSCKYVNLGNNIIIDRFTPLEYDPLVNPRAHEIEEKGVNIRNQAFRDTYTNFLIYCSEKIVLSPEDKVVLLAYLVLQDRITDAQEQLGKLNFEQIYNRGNSTIQLDYIRAYLSMYSESPEFPTAREMARKYSQFPDISWRARFTKINAQLEEYDKGRVIQSAIDTSTAVQIKSNKELAEQAEFLKIEKADSQSVQIIYKNIDRLKVKFYKFDMELLFSMDPFEDNKSRGVESVQANHELKFRVTKSDEFKNSIIQIPTILDGANFIVQVSSIDKLDMTQVYSCSLTAHIDTEFGLVKVFDPEGRPLPACYIKCFSRGKATPSRFYKDGYTDFRGSFDYASLNSDGLGAIDAFSILVISEQFGSKLLRATPPGIVGRLTPEGSTVDGSQSLEATEKFLNSYQTHMFKVDNIFNLP